MPMKKHKPEQIVTLLRQIEVETANGKSTPQACKEAEITVQTYYRRRKEFGGLKLDQAKRLKELERENARLKSFSRGVVSGEADLRQVSLNLQNQFSSIWLQFIW
jgi:putative transposase